MTILYKVNYEIYSNDFWKEFDMNISNWDFSGEFIQINRIKNIIIKYDSRVKYFVKRIGDK